ncbi:MAG: glycosyltransferase family 2 protein, partial [Lachnospiraceae bacterium]|nr:glycosyltransferase family 2 protein [Lachnospiraceae bacterium]
EVSILIVNYNTALMTINAVNSVIAETKGVTYEIIIIDNASTIEDKQLLYNNLADKATIIENKVNMGFGTANNIGAQKAIGKYLFFLNPDTIVLNNVLLLFVDFFNSSTYKIGAIGCILSDTEQKPNNSYGDFITPTGVILQYLGKGPKKKTDFIDSPKYVDFITGAALMIPSELFFKVGAFDQRFFMYCEEVDLQKRISNANYLRVIIPEASIIHLDGGSYKKKANRSALRRIQQDKSYCIYIQKHFSLVQNILFRFLFFVVRLPAVINPHYTVCENINYLRMLISK